jgi:predicted nucleic acid-binding protein
MTCARSGHCVREGAVIGTSVVVKCVIPEDHSEAALRLLTDGVELHAPGAGLPRSPPRCGPSNCILSREQAITRVEWINELIVNETPARNLVVRATVIAFDLHLAVYDALYLALSAQIVAPLVDCPLETLRESQERSSLRQFGGMGGRLGLNNAKRRRLCRRRRLLRRIDPL